ncbi:oleosin 1-like protein [Tanacetum coccineum]
MTDIYPHHEGGRGMQPHFNQGHHLQGQQHYQSTSGPRAHQIAKAATSATAGGMLLVLSGLTLAGTIISLILATPLLVIFSPVLVPAVITMFLLATGFLTSGGFGVAAATVLMWMYRYATDRHPTGADTMDDTAKMLGSKIREKSEHATAGGHYGGIGAGGHVGYQT